MDCSAFDAAFQQFANGRDSIPTELLNIISLQPSCEPSAYLQRLSEFALKAELTEDIFVHYEPLFPDLAMRWPSISSPKHVASALSRVLPVAPSLAVYAEYLLQLNATSTPIASYLAQSSEHSADDIREYLLTLYRLLEYSNKRFSPCVDLNSVQFLLGHEDRVIRILAINVLCIYLQSSDNNRQEMIESYVGKDAVIGVYEGRTLDYGLLAIAEAKRLRILQQRLEEARTLILSLHGSRTLRSVGEGDLSPSIASVYGILLPRLYGKSSRDSALVDTPTTRKNASAIAQCIRDAKPLLLSGEPGSGKTFLVKEIANTLNRLDSLVTIHLGDQTDAKLLIGAYTTGSTPGSFEWRPGVLSTAVREGRWVLIEDIDKAPSDVLSILLPLIEKKELQIPSRGETIVASTGFQIIATLKAQSKKESYTHILGSRFWENVFLENIPEDDLLEIARRRFPLLTKIAPTLMVVFNEICKLYQDRQFHAISKSTVARQISSRDLFKWCARINTLFLNANVVSANDPIPEGLFDAIFMETADCFAASISTLEGRAVLVKKVASAMNIAPQRAEVFLSGHMPEYKNTDKSFNVGRAKLFKNRTLATLRDEKKRPFASTAHALRLLEQIGVAVSLSEPVLLVGETGTGKTTVVQHLADCLRKKLRVINLSQQTESGDLLGGYKPLEMRTLIIPIKDLFDDLFASTFSQKKNARYLEVLGKCFARQQWSRVITLFREAVKMAEATLGTPETPPTAEQIEPKAKRRKTQTLDKSTLLPRWESFANALTQLENQNAQLSKSFAFKFVEGSLVEAARKGDWVLLDEINLAAPDTLESIADLLQEGGGGSIMLSEKGDVERIRAHPEFRIFGCMNPATDVGKRDLPPGIRSRFTELYVVSPDQDINNLLAVTMEYLGDLAIEDQRIASDVAKLYMVAKRLSEENKLVDGANQRPHFSMRTLTRTLSYAVEIAPIYGLRRSIYEGFCMSFLTLLNHESENLLMPHIEKHILGDKKNFKSLMSQIPRKPDDGQNYIQFKHYWLRQGAFEVKEQPHYIITPFVETNLLNLVRATSTRRFPILIQGPTSSGKTSMVEYLAKKTGHNFVRINNHEHTDLQEYLGTYISDSSGRLKFQEGILVEALRNGYWIVLDELNLAPTDVLEALNRLLDDNRELLIPETQEVVKPHKDFMLFATQNPPGLYGGRKVLSRAFRNRFLELHFDDIPEEELEIILRERCQIAPSYCAKIVSVYQELSILRQSTRLFEQKNSFATLRDLFRWANREAVGYQQLAENGYMLLAERVRKPDEKLAVKQVIEKIMRVKIAEDPLYLLERLPEYQQFRARNIETDIVWTKAMRRLFSLVAQAMRNNEPVLLIGETGCGKTSVCQVLAETFGKELHTINAHQNTETGDIIGAQRPVRNRSEQTVKLMDDIKLLLRQHPLYQDRDFTESTLTELLDIYQSLEKPSTEEGKEVITRIEESRSRMNALFEWKDGSLVQAMKQGDFFLLDEISLADDSVLERLNSVLESKRGLVLAEKGPDCGEIIAAEGFQFLATMNPGGDYGKKELSPALRNRFTEIWVPSITESDDILEITKSKLIPDAIHLANAIVDFSRWFADRYNLSAASSISIRNVLAWVKFINIKSELSLEFRFVHGAALVYVDGLGANPSAVLSINQNEVQNEKKVCIQKLSDLAGKDLWSTYSCTMEVTLKENTLSVGPFSLPTAGPNASNVPFSLKAPTTASNAMRILRAMQLKKPILLEGSPGVGKTSLVSALAAMTGNPLCRINLSEQTDLMDLFGSDIPVEGGSSGEFAWRDAPFLQAMQKGHWVLLDEMNLASQSVLEGLNACLDHRGEAYIAELDRSFKLHPDCAVFAAQNPHHQGGGRKGLPASFVNRFTVVYADSFNTDDLQMIAGKLFPKVSVEETSKLISFICRLEMETSQKRSFGGLGSPWEFNLRDILRWMDLLSEDTGLFARRSVSDFLNIVVKQRFRTLKDRMKVDELFEETFGEVASQRHLYYQLLCDSFQVGHAVLPRVPGPWSNSATGLAILQSQLEPLETIMTCVHRNWPCILVGASGTGKSSMLKLLSSLVGVELAELALNSDIDTMDIVGGFEQVDALRKVSSLLEDVLLHLRKEMQAGLANGQSIQAELGELLRVLIANKKNLKQSDLENLVNKLQNLSSEDETVRKFRVDLGNALEEVRAASLARFEWVDGLLVKAVQQGKWLVLDNANLCSASVLDRLNSLLEPNGFLIINEHSGPDGQPRLVKPHPDFRLFLTVDPRNGELSRAMRNRAIEVFVGLEAVTTSAGKILEKDRMAMALRSPRLVTDSSVSRLEVFPDTEAHLEVSHIDVLHAFFSHLTPPQLHLLKRWNGSSDPWLWNILPERMQSMIELLEDFSQLFFHTSIQKLLSDFGVHLQEKLGLDETFFKSQSIHPLVNDALLPYKSDPSEGDVFEAVATAFENALEIVGMGKMAESVSHRSTTTGFERLTLQSRRSATGARAKAEARLVKYLISIRDILLHWMDNSIGDTEKKGQQKLAHLIALWQDLADVSLSANADESVTRVYLGFFHEWFSDSASLLPPHLADSLSKAFSNFSSKFTLTTGFAMEAIWNLSRPSVPTSLEMWELYHTLCKLAETFDKSVATYSISNESIRQTRVALIEALAVLLVTRGDVPLNIIKDLKDGVSELEAARPEGTRKSNFRLEFDCILKCLELSIAVGSGKSELNNQILKLSQGAGRKTLELLRYMQHRVDIRFSYEAILETLWNSYSENEDDASEGPRYLLEGKLGRDTVVTADLLKESSIGELLNTRAELEEFARQFAQHTLVLTVNHVDALTNLLTRKIKEVTELPTSSSNNQAFANTARTYFEPALLIIEDLHGKSESEKFKDLGRAWILYSLGSMVLFVPNAPFDPARRTIVIRDQYLKRKARLEQKKDGYVFFEKYFTGQTTSRLIKRLEQQIENLGDEPTRSSIVRPAVSQMNELHAEFASIIETVLGGNFQEKMLPAILEGLHGYENQEAMLQRNLSRIIERLKENFPIYKDLLDPLVGYLYSLKLGLSLLVMSIRGAFDGRDIVLQSLTPTAFLEWHPAITIPEGLSSDDWRLHQFTLLSTRKRVEIYNSETIGSINDTLNRLFETWRVRIETEKAEAAAKSSMYTYRGLEENGEENDFRALFPDHENQDAETVTEQKKPHQKLACEIAQIHYETFDDKDISDTILLRQVRSGINIAKALPNTAPSCAADIQSWILADMIALKDARARINGKIDKRNYDFYHDENLEEAWKLVTVLQSVKARFKVLQQAWPEHVTLQDVLDEVKNIVSLPNTIPLAKFLVRLEKLHGIVDEWQKVASREYSAAEQYDAITNLIIRWRKLELETWPRLLDIEEEKCKEEADSFWFFLYESIVANASALATFNNAEDLSKHIEQLVVVLCSFLTSSTIGQFPHRLSLVSLFQRHIDALVQAGSSNLGRISNALINILSYFREYQPLCTANLQEDRKRLEKEVMDVVLLASWKDTNILALRDSAKRSHHKLYKVIRKYRDALSAPMAGVLGRNMPDFSVEEVEQRSDIQPDIGLLQKAQEICRNAVSNWDERPRRLQDVAVSSQSMIRVFEDTYSNLDAVSQLKAFVDNIISTVKELQKETPSVLTEENKDAVKHLKNRKRKAFTDSLKVLRLMGLRSNLSGAVLSAQSSLEKILAGVPALESKNLPITESAKLFSRALEFLPKLRRSLGEHSADLTSQEVARSVGYIEHLVNIQIGQRGVLKDSLKEYDGIKALASKFETISYLLQNEGRIYGQLDINNRNLLNIRKRLDWLPHVLRLAIEVLSAHESFAGKTYSSVQEQLEQYLASAVNLHQRLQSSPMLSENVWTNMTKDVVDDAAKYLDSARKRFPSLLDENPELAYIFNIILPWANYEDAAFGSHSNEEKSIEQLDLSLQNICNSIFVALQQLKAVKESFPKDFDEQGWFLKHNVACSKAIKSLHITRITALLNTLIEDLYRLGPFNAAKSSKISALFASHLPIINSYLTICERSIETMLNLHKAISRLTRTLSATASTLTESGFCMPQEASDEQGGNAQAESGTGLGNGEGMEDISKDVGPDEDMNELAQEKDEESGEKGETEENKDAVDVEDMEGKLEDVAEKEDGEEDEGKDEEDEGLDEETGNVDDLDPGAVDEKMWDGEEEENAREKEGDGKSEKQKNGDELEAQRNENQQSSTGNEGDVEEKVEEGDEGDEEEEGPDHDDEVKQQDGETMDQQVPEVDTLDLPDNMELDGGEEDPKGDEDDDLNMGDLPDEEASEQETNQNDESIEEAFPEMDDKKEEQPENSDDANEGEQDKEEQSLEENEEVPEGQDPLQTKSDDKTKPASLEEQAPSDVQGVDGNDDNDQEENAENAARQETGQESHMDDAYDGKGTKEAEAEENSGEQTSREKASKDEGEAEESMAERSAFKKLGDALEKFHRQYKEILEAREEDELESKERLDENMDLDDAEYEHLPNEDAKHDLQALGAANEEQAKHLDDSMAIDSGEKEELPQAFSEDEKNEDTVEHEDQQLDKKEEEADANSHEESFGAMVGKPRQAPTESADESSHEKMVIDDFDDVDIHLNSNVIVPTAQDIASASQTGRELWTNYESQTRDLSTALCEQLRLILEPTLATKMRGDFRTGKRLNMKRIIPYIASQYKKDKIWMRRTKPSKRQYQVMIAVDDSKSMKESNSVELTYKTVAMISKALAQLEVGQISIASFGEKMNILHPFDKPFTSDAGASSFDKFTFAQLHTNVNALLESSLTYFSEAARPASSSSNAEIAQLQLIISDGICEDHAYLRRLVRRAREMRVMIVFVVIDAGREGGGSILEMSMAKFEDGRLKMERYLDGFPFEYYIIVKDVGELPGVLSGALRQWLQEVVEGM